MLSQKSNPQLRIGILCLFPKSLERFFSLGLLAKAQEEGLLQITLHDLRKWSGDKRKSVDDRPYGGGAGMILKIEPLAAAIKEIKSTFVKTPYVIFTSPSGTKYNQSKAKSLLKKRNLIIVCGRYEGVDERFIKSQVDEEISIGDYILNGGEAAALVMVESLSRLIPGVLGNEHSLKEESFNRGLLEYPQYTRPEVFKNKKVPAILLSGNHQKIKLWRFKKSLEKTKKIRPDLLESR